MSAELPDVLSILRHAAKEVIRTGGGMTACMRFRAEVDPQRVLALIECAEALKDVLPLIDANKVALSPESCIALDGACDALTKLEAL